jgi:hypothetical protein
VRWPRSSAETVGGSWALSGAVCHFCTWASDAPAGRQPLLHTGFGWSRGRPVISAPGLSAYTEAASTFCTPTSGGPGDGQPFLHTGFGRSRGWPALSAPWLRKLRPVVSHFCTRALGGPGDGQPFLHLAQVRNGEPPALSAPQLRKLRPVVSHFCTWALGGPRGGQPLLHLAQVRNGEPPALSAPPLSEVPPSTVRNGTWIRGSLAAQEHILQAMNQSPHEPPAYSALHLRRSSSTRFQTCGRAAPGRLESLRILLMDPGRAEERSVISTVAVAEGTKARSGFADVARDLNRSGFRFCCWYPGARPFQVPFLLLAPARAAAPSSVSVLPTPEATHPEFVFCYVALESMRPAHRTRRRLSSPSASRVRILPAVAPVALDGANHCVQTTKGATRTVNGTRTSSGPEPPREEF